MRYKVGIRVPRTLDSRMFGALAAIARSWDFIHNLARPVEIGSEATITSWADGIHGVNSYHKREGRAVDVRTKTIPRPLVPVFVEDLKRRIGALGFDIVAEDFNGEMEHLHLELDSRADG